MAQLANTTILMAGVATLAAPPFSLPDPDFQLPAFRSAAVAQAALDQSRPVAQHIKASQLEIAEWVSQLRAKQLTAPVSGVDAESLKGSFSQLRGDRQHNAVDIIAPRGTPILAVEDGIAARLFTSKQGGLTIYQTDADGKFVYYYAHLDSYATGLSQGGSIKRGQIIGYVGSSGNANPESPHLHFAIWRATNGSIWSGVAVDPYLVFQNRKTLPSGHMHAGQESMLPKSADQDLLPSKFGIWI